jgi:excisionase family DNA binding protein
MSTRSKKQEPASIGSPAVLAEPAPAPLLYDIPSTAKILSTTTFAVRELCRSNRLKFVRLGHRWLISLDAIHRFIRDAERAA